jgi:hypothetical protein
MKNTTVYFNDMPNKPLAQVEWQIQKLRKPRFKSEKDQTSIPLEGNSFLAEYLTGINKYQSPGLLLSWHFKQVKLLTLLGWQSLQEARSWEAG